MLSGCDEPADLVEVTLALAREMLELAGIEPTRLAALRDGSALERFRAMVVAQGGDPDAPLPRASHVETAHRRARRHPRASRRPRRRGRGVAARSRAELARRTP